MSELTALKCGASIANESFMKIWKSIMQLEKAGELTAFQDLVHLCRYSVLPIASKNMALLQEKQLLVEQDGRVQAASEDIINVVLSSVVEQEHCPQEILLPENPVIENSDINVLQSYHASVSGNEDPLGFILEWGKNAR